MNLFFFILSGAVVAWGQPSSSLFIAMVAAVCGFALFWKVASCVQSVFRRFWLATGWFAIVQLIQLAWMTSIEYQGIYILFVYGALALGLGLQFGLLTIYIHRIPLVASASIWTLFEWIRLYFLCGFTFNPVGLALTTTPFSLQSVTLFGIFGLSFIVMLTNLAVWKKRWKAAASLAVFPYLAGGILWGYHHSKLRDAPTMSVALVQTALLPSQKLYFPERPSDFVSPYEQWARINALLTKVREKVDLVVLPEAAVPFSDNYPLYSKEHVLKILGTNSQDRLFQVSNLYWINALGNKLGADMIVGLDGEENGCHYSSAFFSSKGEMERYDKQILLPLAEYLPFKGLKSLTASYGIKEFFTHGKGPRIFQSKFPIATSICYEETFGDILRQGKRAGAKLFVNLTNDNWYPNSNLPQAHFDMARVQTVANGTPLVRACNSGVTAAVDSLGNVVAQLDDWNQPAVLVAKIPIFQISTLYAVWGDMGIVVVSIIFLSLSLFINRKSLFVNKIIKSTL